jgi:hypothetical protein
MAQASPLVEGREVIISISGSHGQAFANLPSFLAAIRRMDAKQSHIRRQY